MLHRSRLRRRRPGDGRGLRLRDQDRRRCRPDARGRTVCSTATAPAARRPAPRSRSAAEPPAAARPTRAPPAAETATSRPARTATTATRSTATAARTGCKVEGGFTCNRRRSSRDAQDCQQGRSTPANAWSCRSSIATSRTRRCRAVTPTSSFRGDDHAADHGQQRHGAGFSAADRRSGTGAATVAFNKRYCVPNSSGPAKQNDSTARCWDIAQANLDANGRPAFNPAQRAGCGRDASWPIASSPTSATTPTAGTCPATRQPTTDRSTRLAYVGRPPGTRFTR